jgi:[phosphatase 2A protein]-leucine-carboxy methyltransferase
MFPPSHHHSDADTAIRLTNCDAAAARLSAVQKQYLHDPFIKHLVPRANLQPPGQPLINVGTFVRSTALDDLIHRWLLLSQDEGKPCQIVSLGAGNDTRFWRIAVSFGILVSRTITVSRELLS